jgi:hypothetical protein
MKHSGCVIAGAAALLLAVTSGTQAASDCIIGEEDSPPAAFAFHSRRWSAIVHKTPLDREF